MPICKYRELVRPFNAADDAVLSDMIDGLDASWWMFDRVAFGAFVAVAADGGECPHEVWGGLRNAWAALASTNSEFVAMLDGGEESSGAGIISSCQEYLEILGEMQDAVGPIGLTVMSMYLGKVPTMFVEHMDALVRVRVRVSEVTGEPCMEYAEELLDTHISKMKVFGLKLDRTVFRMNSTFMRRVTAAANQALPVFMGAVTSGLTPREAMGHVCNRFNLPSEML